MNFLKGYEIIDLLSNKAEDKKKNSLNKLILLGILGGAFIGLGYLGYVKVVSAMPASFGGLGQFLGSSIFPIGLIAIYLINAELATGNTLTMTLGYLDKRVNIIDLVKNWTVVALSNAVGAIIVAYLFGHLVGLTEGAYLETTLKIANAKVEVSTMSAIVSGIGANIFVCLAVWMATSTNKLSEKIFGLWFPVMTFVIIGFQHAIANAFIIPAAIFSGQSSLTIFDFITNFLLVFLGNAIGGSLIVGVPAFISNRRCTTLNNCEIPFASK